MKKLILVFALIICTQDVKAIDIFEIISGELENTNKAYPEERNKQIKIANLKSPLKYTEKEKNKAKNLIDTIFLDTGLVNKFNLGTGLLDVTLQVKNGVKYAIKDSFEGFSEFQRRKTSEEIINANLLSHKKTESIIFSENRENLIWFAKKISNKFPIKQLVKVSKWAAFAILYTVVSFIVIKAVISKSLSIEGLVQGPILQASLAWLLVNFSSQIINAIFDLALSLENNIGKIFSNIIDLNFFQANKLETSWQELINNFGYLPSISLSFIDIFSQFIFMIFIAALVIHLVLGKIFSPIWAACLASDTLSKKALSSFLFWLKSFTILALIPVSRMILNSLTYEFGAMGSDFAFLEISISIAGLLCLPLISYFIYKQ